MKQKQTVTAKVDEPENVLDLLFLKKEKIYLVNSYPTEIDKSGKIRYFIKGHGWKNTKNFTVIPKAVPDRRTKLTWMSIGMLGDKYGLEVAEHYANNRTAGIMARQTAAGALCMYKTIKDVLPEMVYHKFFDLLAVDYTMAVFGWITFDIAQTDKNFAVNDKDYDNEKCTYKGKPCSMKAYVTQVLGEPYAKAIDLLCGMNMNYRGENIPKAG